MNTGAANAARRIVGGDSQTAFIHRPIALGVRYVRKQIEGGDGAGGCGKLFSSIIDTVDDTWVVLVLADGTQPFRGFRAVRGTTTDSKSS